ncbi:MAG: STAS domain-containing protein [Actinomycetota bacterium]
MGRSTGHHQELEAALRESVRRHRQVRVDLSELAFLDGAGMGAFRAAARRLEGRGRLVLTSPRPVVEKICRVPGLQRRPNVEIVHSAAHRAR